MSDLSSGQGTFMFEASGIYARFPFFRMLEKRKRMELFFPLMRVLRTFSPKVFDAGFLLPQS